MSCNIAVVENPNFLSWKVGINTAFFLIHQSKTKIWKYVDKERCCRCRKAGSSLNIAAWKTETQLLITGSNV